MRAPRYRVPPIGGAAAAGLGRGRGAPGSAAGGDPEERREPSCCARPVWKRGNLKEESGGYSPDPSGHRSRLGGRARGAETGTSTSSALKVQVLGVSACEGRILIS